VLRPYTLHPMRSPWSDDQCAAIRLPRVTSAIL